jgi:putative oxidoreductase
MVSNLGGIGLALPGKKEMIKIVEKLYRLLITVASSLQSPFLLFVRLYWGWQLAQSGWGKLHNIDKVTEFFTTLGLPAPGFTAHFIASLEFVGGILLILGLASRLNALVLTINMIMAYVIADHDALMSIFSNPDKFYAAAPYTFLVASLLVLIFGPGLFSVDAAIARLKHYDT